MADKNIDINAGVQAQNGFAFQRNSTICVMLDKYDLLIGNNFFVCIEHHDDIIFTFLNESGSIKEIDSYQSKKSSSYWSTDKELGEIVSKMTRVGHNLLLDTMPKDENYVHNLFFLTNKSINLNCGRRKAPKYSEIVKEDNLLVSFSELHEEIKKNLISKMTDFSHEICQLSNVQFMHLEFGNTDKAQREQLIGKISQLFKDKNVDAVAALETIIILFRDVETVYNQGGQSKLLDESKRIYSLKILEAFNVIENKTKTYTLWRQNSEKIAEHLKITLSISKNYKAYIDNSFDYFKDLKMVEFQKIYNFVKETNVDEVCYNVSSSIIMLNEEFKRNNQTLLKNEIVLFAIISAYAELRI